jgi:CubicO group peptidase (beta-lactamase class C family)
LLRRAARFLIAWLEALIMTTIFNARVFEAVCLPSSNGFWTAIAVARLYGALANAGRVQLPDTAGSVELLDAAKLAALLHKVRTDARVPSPEGEALNSLGFSPWPHLCAGADTGSLVLGHGGMGGSVAWADVDRGLSVAILRSRYSPISLGCCAATRELAECIRAHA